MTYQRKERKPTETREIEAKVGIVKNAIGSAMFRIGKTTAYAAVYGPRNLYPKFLQDPQKGVLRVNYNMMPFSGSGDRVRPGTNRRSKEISMVTEKAITPVLDLSDFPNAGVDLYIELPQTDAGTRCAGICAASMALADAGLSMKELVSAISVGIVDGTVVVDLDYAEEAYEEGHVADIPVAMIPSTGEITLLQMDGLISKENLAKGLEYARECLANINEIQRKALKEKYAVHGSVSEENNASAAETPAKETSPEEKTLEEPETQEEGDAQ